MEGLFEIDREARKESFMNNLDGRIKLISAILIIIYAVSTTNLFILVVMEIYLLILIYLSNVSSKYALKRIALVIPFGGFVALIVPHQLAMLLNLTVRYLFFFYDQLENILNAQSTRCFDIFNNKTPYKWRLRKVGETITMMFLRAFEQGEKVYLSMMSRGYSENTRVYRGKTRLDLKDYAFLTTTLLVIVVLQLINIFVL